MKDHPASSAKLFLPIAAVVFCALLATSVGIGYVAAEQTPGSTTQIKNQADPTADARNMKPADRELTHRIRKSIHLDKTLSIYAHNIKIIAQDGEVTLRGLVRSDDEKSYLQSKAGAVAGDGNVTNQLEVAPSH